MLIKFYDNLTKVETDDRGELLKHQLKIEQLFFNGSNNNDNDDIHDINFLTVVKNIRELALYDTWVTQLSPVKYLNKLRTLCTSGTFFKSLLPLDKSKLRILIINEHF